MKQSNSQLADVLRISKALEKNAGPGEEEKLYRRFTGTTQEPIRLAAALRGFFLPQPVDPAHRDVYEAYLRRRIRPAVEVLIETDDIFALQQLELLGWFDAALVDYFLQLACSRRKSAALVWLLQLKEQKYGFHDRDFSL